MSESLRLVAGVLLVGAGVTLWVVAALGARTRLRRNRFAGVRTPATLSSDAAFERANQVAAAPLAAAAAVAVVGGVAVLFAGPGATGWVVLGLAGLGVLVLGMVGGAAGDRAARAVAAAEPAPAACSGTCAGCDLVAGCRPTPATDNG